MKNFTKKILALAMGAVMLLGLLAGCSEETVPAKETTPETKNYLTAALGGRLVLSAEASVMIDYDQNGMVLEVIPYNDYGITITEDYTGYQGKPCTTVVKDLIDASAKECFLRDASSIMLKLAKSSGLPTETFLDDLAKVAATAASENGSSAPVVTVGLDGLDNEGYINAEHAQILLKNHLGVTELDRKSVV